MSDDYLPLLIAELQGRIAKLEQEVESLKADMYEESEGAESEGAEDCPPVTYMDGTPIR